jgi:hypothetical protein
MDANKNIERAGVLFPSRYRFVVRHSGKACTRLFPMQQLHAPGSLPLAKQGAQRKVGNQEAEHQGLLVFSLVILILQSAVRLPLSRLMTSTTNPKTSST